MRARPSAAEAAKLVPWPKLLAAGVVLALWPAILLAVGGDGRWAGAWIFGAWFVVVCGTVVAWLYRHDPALLAERYRAPGTGGQSRADQWVVVGLGLGFVAWIVVPALDHRFAWLPGIPLAARAASVPLLAVAAFFLFRAFADNTFVSPLVRVQTERGQRVVSTGVYGIVRHPMYLGATSMFIGGPLLLGSWCGLGVWLLLAALIVYRIGLEEALLVKDLEGYEAYRQRVHYRLLPHVW
jgi:protein-S-isoprenylcysteine O-methyltransferase Ste14